MKEKIMANFIENCLAGTANPDDLDDYIEKWHNGNSPLPVHEYLGMTWDEYGAILKDAKAIEKIIENRRKE